MTESNVAPAPLTKEECLAAIRRPGGSFPFEVVSEIAARREEFLPEMLNILQEAANDPHRIMDQESYRTRLIALHLLAEWREKRAYPIILKAFSLPKDECYDFWGDAIDSLGKFIISTFDGDLESLIAFIRNREHDQYARICAFYGLCSLYLFGMLPRDRFLAITRDLLAEFDPAKTYDDTDWTYFSGVVAGCAQLRVPELEPLVKRLFDHDMIDSWWVTFECFKKGMANPQIEEETRANAQFTPVTSACEELKTWYGGRELDKNAWKRDYELSSEDDDDIPEELDLPPPPPPEKYPGTGRNEPCPCGSGKKYKKCCLT
ncbi:MAG: hypothetical protein OZSIB_3728 [Candidatus Ozemobacter sibiricus]|jgi:hypothetical protein|uniref:DUF1186 domain-containing protein n=1 Tax=Candidatus Ozemobacter sibiricus TaxID=2268124 RepID=A0A367ZCF5_9BACT|nr:MAG: hypothetical protein OZSIB_3728 [Candidatus Ozemobacter sibiricus]